MVAIVGAGPGDPELITVKGLKLLREADVVVYDRLIPRELLKEAHRASKLIYVGKEPGRHTLSQDEINKLLYEEALKGNLVVRLKGGDPLVFGRGEEECLYLLERGVKCLIVPGVPSFLGASAYAGVPLNSRGIASSFAVITGTKAEGVGGKASPREVARCVDTIVVLMGARKASQVLSEIEEVRGPHELVAVVMNATTKEQEVLVGPISEVRRLASGGRIRNPAVIIVGRVVELREKGLWRVVEYSF